MVVRFGGVREWVMESLKEDEHGRHPNQDTKQESQSHKPKPKPKINLISQH